MCNVCNSGGNCCGFTNTSANNGCGCWGWFGTCQRLCRDCNGNIRVLNNGCGCNSCGCNRCRPCNCCVCCRNNYACPCCVGCNVNNGCGGITTFGTNGVNSTVSANNFSTNDDYYNRQYALNGRSNRCGDRCGCGCW